MKIALPTNDGVSVSPHFGRSAGFLVFDVADGRINGQELRANSSCHSHEEGACGQHSAGEGEHSHAAILSALAGCDVVICAGMGWRAAEALRSAGVGEIIVAAPGPAGSLVTAYLAGTLAASNETYCRCSH
ncbi:MAG TPA: NifB/NifX family molybdenum-iron cluster-binding protein [Bryobacteraceae bacterium]|nr:NifB/NifX family molybdenum-iron cluster-binding protein [Bryobacteraceae bacterium]